VNEARMSFGGHLDELRQRIMRAGFAVLCGMVVGWNFREPLFSILLRPLEVAWFCQSRGLSDVRQPVRWMLDRAAFEAARAQILALPAAQQGIPPEPTVHFPDPTSAFVAYLKIAAIGGTVLALPVVFWQLWSFIAPGLYPKEKKLVVPFVTLATGIFVGGMVFGYHLVFPVAYQWMLSFAGQVANSHVKVTPTIMMEDYLSFSAQMLFAFGVVFVLPLLVFFLSLAGLVTWRQLLGFGRYFTVIAFILAAILTPSTDVYSQVMLALPLVALYYVAVVLAYFFGPKTARKWRSAGPPPDDAPLPPEKQAAIAQERAALEQDQAVRAKEQAIIDAKKKAALAKPAVVIPGVKPGMSPDEIIAAKHRAAALTSAPKAAMPVSPEEEAAREAKIRAWRDELERVNKKG
jgi:sec-independent protein translocase protein TatC